MIMGASSGSVVIFSLKEKRNSRLLQIPDALQFPAPSALALSPDEEVVVVGHNDGALGFYETNSGKLIKFSREFHKFPILVLKFYNLDGKHLKESRLITSDSGFKTCKVIFKKGIFSYDLDSFQLIPESRSILQVEVVESSIGKSAGGEREGGGKGGEGEGGVEGGDGEEGEGEGEKGENLRGRIIALASERDVMIIEIEPKARRIISFPPPPEGGFPSISWNNGVGRREERKKEEGEKSIEEGGRKKVDEKKEGNQPTMKKVKEKVDNIQEEVQKEEEEKKKKEEMDDDENKKEEEEKEETEEDDEEDEYEENEKDNDNEERKQNRSGLYLIIGWGFHVYMVNVYLNDQRVDAKLMGVFKVQSKLIYVSFLTENLCLLFFEGKVQIINIYDLPEFREIKVEELDKDEFFLKKLGSSSNHNTQIQIKEENKEELNELKEENPEGKEENKIAGQVNDQSNEKNEFTVQTDVVEVGVGVEVVQDENEFVEREVIPESNLIDFGYILYYSLMVKEIKTSLAVNCYNLSFNRWFPEKTLFFMHMHEKVCISRLTVLSWESYMSKVASTLPWQDSLNLLLQIYQGFTLLFSR